MKQASLSVENINKYFVGIHALKDVSLTFAPGEVHALLGENGAGKSTLCKMLSGASRPDSGVIRIDGREYDGLTPNAAKAEGIGMIYQEFNLVPEMTVYENLFLGKEIRKGLDVDRNAMIARSKELFAELGVEVDPTKKINELSVAYCQLVEIGKSMLEKVRFLIMDEPTAPLTTQEVEALFQLVRKLKSQNVTIIYISHRIEELLELADRVTIMRDGEVIQTLETAKTNRAELIRLMVGRELGGEFPESIRTPGNMEEPVLQVKNLNTRELHDISFSLYKGEVLGLAGLVGSGRSEIIRAIFGADGRETGEIAVNGRAVRINTPRDAIEQGIAMIPEDRKRQGLHLELPIADNISLIKINALSKLLTVSRSKERALIDRFIKALSIKLASPEAHASSLSGGNQQKVVLSKWLSTEADILFLDEPTRGIDVGAKKEIYELMDRLRAEGRSIIVISSEMLEVVGLCSRVLVMCEGRLNGELRGDQVTQENILELASGGTLPAVNIGS